MAHLARPGWFPPLRSVYYRLLFGRMARRADLVMADSRFTAREAVRLAGVDPGRVRTVYLSADNRPADPAPLLGRLGLETGYLLCVGTVEPRKNIPALLDALALLREQRPRLRLLVAGRWGWGRSALRRRLSSQEGVVWVGALGRRDLERAYCGASLLVYPSLYEGFGLPPLEAARAGVPSVVGPAAALTEVYDGAAFHAGGDPESLAETVARALESPPPEGMERLARRLTNHRMAEAVAEVYSEAVR
jgi:glycosyltransferase involved in cell wall biosynthesis